MQIHTSENAIKSIKCRSSIENCSDILYIYIYFLYYIILHFEMSDERVKIYNLIVMYKFEAVRSHR